MLPWLQRAYVTGKFDSYRPLSDHEDDLPYDWDHICPRSHWQLNGRKVWVKQTGFKNEGERKEMMPKPWVVGDSLGNMRLVDFAQNRKDGNADIFEKMPFLADPDQFSEIGTPADFLLDDAQELSFWKQVGDGTCYRWDDEQRRAAFQKVVGRRIARLYALFCNVIGFGKWKQPEP